MQIFSEERTFDIKGRLFLPFHNLWNQRAYYFDGDFSFDPFTIRANSTSGSPVILGEDFFVGFIDFAPGSYFVRKGNRLIIKPAEGASFLFGKGDTESLWQKYNEEIWKRHKYSYPQADQRILKAIEYCTWMEQKAQCPADRKATSMLSETFVTDYLERLDRLDLPKGVLTLDHGWMIGSDDFDFSIAEPDTSRFPDLGRTVKEIESAGYIPGLWFAPVLYYKDSPLFAKHPELMGTPFTGANEGGFSFPVIYPEARGEGTDILFDHYRRMFAPYVEMGFRKFKIDFLYNEKDNMIANLKQIHGALKSLEPTVEVESHIPDIFASFYQDSVRLNDLIIEQNPQWRELFEDHYRVCLNSAYKTQLNLDHLGTNSPDVSEAEFLYNLAQFRGKEGYPVVSLLPDRFSRKCLEELKGYLWDYAASTSDAQ